MADFLFDQGKNKIEGMPKNQIMGIQNEVSELNSQIFISNIAANTILTSGKSVKFEDGTLANSSYYSATDFIDISGMQILLYSKAFTNSTSISSYGMAFYNESKTYISGNRIGYYAEQRHYELTEIEVPEGAKYARFTTDNSLSNFVVYDYEQYNESIENQNKLYFDLINKNVNLIDYAKNLTYTEGKAVKYSDGTILNSTAYCATNFIDISEISIMYYSRIFTTLSNVPQTGLAFYDENEDYISGERIGYNAEFPHYEMKIIEVPNGAKYARFTININIDEPFVVYDYEQYNESLTTKINNVDNKLINYSQKLGLHVIPESEGVLNVIKRCRQMTDIEWTPAVDLPRYMRENTTPPYNDDYNIGDSMRYIGKFEAGKKYKGIPYGRCTDYITEYGYSNTYVGLTVPFDSFISAIENPESIISKQSEGSLTNHHSIPFAAVCSALTCYALNVAYRATENIPSISGLNFVSHLIVDNEYINPNLIKLGDVLNLQGDHTVMITDLILDNYNNVQFIEISEAAAIGAANRNIEGGETGGLCRRVGYNVEDFFNRFGEYDLLRYEYIDSIPYTPNKFVNVGDELNMARLFDLPCLPYLGEGFIYKSGYIPNSTIVITSTYYNFLRVFKDGTEITGSPFTIAENATSIDVGFSQTGNYEAYLCNMSSGSNTRISAKCHWKVI